MQKTAEELFAEELIEGMEEMGKMLKGFFRTMTDKNLETLLLISMAILTGAGNMYQVMQLLGLPKTSSYNGVKNISVYCWQRLLQDHLYKLAIPILSERLSKSDATKSRDGLVMAVDDTVIARIAEKLGYVWKWWSGQLKRVTNGQNVIALILVVGDIIIPLDIRIVSKQGQGIKTKPEIYRDMLDSAKKRFSDAGIDIDELITTGDSAYLSKSIAEFCRGEESEESHSKTDDADTNAVPHAGNPVETEANEDIPSPVITGIFNGKDNYVFEIDGISQKAGQWRKDMAENIEEGWGTKGQPVYRTKAESPAFGSVILLFYIPKGMRAVRYLIVIGRPLRSGEILHAYSFHHRIEDFWKLMKGTLHAGDMKLQGREGAHACVGVKIIGCIVINMMKQNLRKKRRFRNITINKLVNLCPKFVDILKIFKEHFHKILPDNYNLDKALA